MDEIARKSRLVGCYVTIPTMFRDEDLGLDLRAVQRVARFVIDGGIKTGIGVILAGGAAGDFSTMTFDERVATAEAVVEAAAGRIPVVMGTQSTSTREAVNLAKAAQRLGAEYIQVSCPFYFTHTQEDFFEHVKAISEAADIGLIVYNTFWTSTELSFKTAEKLLDLRNVVGLKWATRDTGYMEFAKVVTHFADRWCVIDNQVQFATSHKMGARGFEAHMYNYWPQWGVELMTLLNEKKYEQVQEALVRVALPFYSLWQQIEQEYTSGDGYLDKLCMELVGLNSSRCRPPTRDIREKYREQTRRMLLAAGVPGARTTTEPQ
jgi:dihydrodipicolinate synthase/N-acetylneuraminate lyase